MIYDFIYPVDIGRKLNVHNTSYANESPVYFNKHPFWFSIYTPCQLTKFKTVKNSYIYIYIYIYIWNKRATLHWKPEYLLFNRTFSQLWVMHNFLFIARLNPFQANILFLYPLKTLENQNSLDAVKVCGKGIFTWNNIVHYCIVTLIFCYFIIL